MQCPCQLTSAFVMGDFCLWLGCFPGLVLKRGGVLYWNSRTRSASGLNGLFSCAPEAGSETRAQQQ
jgi:hypothetical protein